MTKLTQQEIEKEREMFEEWFFFKRKESINKYWLHDCKRYKFQPMTDQYESWLARAELAKGGE